MAEFFDPSRDRESSPERLDERVEKLLKQGLFPMIQPQTSLPQEANWQEMMRKSIAEEKAVPLSDIDRIEPISGGTIYRFEPSFWQDLETSYEYGAPVDLTRMAVSSREDLFMVHFSGKQRAEVWVYQRSSQRGVNIRPFQGMIVTSDFEGLDEELGLIPLESERAVKLLKEKGVEDPRQMMADFEASIGFDRLVSQGVEMRFHLVPSDMDIYVRVSYEGLKESRAERALRRKRGENRPKVKYVWYSLGPLLDDELV